MAVRQLDGGRTRFLQFVQLAAEADDDNAKKFFLTFSELTKWEQAKVSFDLVCLSSGISRVELLKSVVGIAFEHMTDVANLVAAAAHPAIVERTVASAKRINSGIGQRDRHALLTHAGFLPVSKGATINVSMTATANAAAAAAAAADPSVPKFLSAVDAATAAREAIAGEIADAPSPDEPPAA